MQGVKGILCHYQGIRVRKQTLGDEGFTHGILIKKTGFQELLDQGKEEDCACGELQKSLFFSLVSAALESLLHSLQRG